MNSQCQLRLQSEKALLRQLLLLLLLPLLLLSEKALLHCAQDGKAANSTCQQQRYGGRLPEIVMTDELGKPPSQPYFSRASRRQSWKTSRVKLEILQV